MVANPPLLLADEPTGNLDQKTGAVVVDLMFDLARKQGTAVVLITHDPALAARADRVFTMMQGELTETTGARDARSAWAAIRIGLLDMRGDLRRFVLLVVCLAVGTALIAGVNSVGASITRAIDDGAAELMGGDVELSRADRLATADELAPWPASAPSRASSTPICAPNRPPAMPLSISPPSARPIRCSAAVRSPQLPAGHRSVTSSSRP